MDVFVYVGVAGWGVFRTGLHIFVDSYIYMHFTLIIKKIYIYDRFYSYGTVL